MSSPIHSVFHPTDFSEDSQTAFAHALKIALATNATLRILHVAHKREAVDWMDFPHIRPMLERWGVLPPGSSQQDVLKLGIHVEKSIITDRHPLHGIERHLEQHGTDGLEWFVMAAHHREQLFMGLQTSVSLPLVWDCLAPTLIVPSGSDGFISRHNGSVDLRNLLFPAAQHPNAQPAINAARQLATALKCSDIECECLHIGDDDPPHLIWRGCENWSVRWRTLEGSVEDNILEEADSSGADLIVLATEGRHGIQDALFGSTTERVARLASCPVLAVPVAPAEAMALRPAYT